MVQGQRGKYHGADSNPVGDALQPVGRSEDRPLHRIENTVDEVAHLALLHELTGQQRQHWVPIAKRLDACRILAARKFITEHAGLELTDFVLVQIAHVVPDQLRRCFWCRPHTVPLQRSEHIGAIPEGGHERDQESRVRRTASNVALIFSTCRGCASASASGFGVSIACPRIGSTISLNFAG